MKRLAIASLSTLILLSAAPTVLKAQEVTAVNSSTAGTTTTARGTVSPFDLVHLAYQGLLEDEGIPSAGGLIHQYGTRRITAEDIVQAAVDANRLSAEAIHDSTYLRAVDNYLLTLRSNSRG